MKKMRFLRFFLRGLASLMNAGIPFLNGLHTLRKQQDERWAKTLVERLIVRVSSGETFASALGKEPKVFPNLIVNLIYVGEETASLPANLEKAAEYVEQSFEFKTKITKALTYPVFLLGVMFFGLVVLLKYFIPTFFPVFDGMNLALPLSTRTLLAFAKIFSTVWFWIGVVALVGLLWGAYALIQRDHEKKHYLDRFLLALPGVGNVIRRGLFAQLTRTLGTAHRAGISVDRGLGLVEEMADNEVFRRFLQDSRLALAYGADLSQFFLTRKNFAPPLVGHLLAVGEKTGGMDTLLPKCTQLLEEETDYFLGQMFKFLEPGILAVMGVLVTFVMLSVFSPLYGMAISK